MPKKWTAKTDEPIFYIYVLYRLDKPEGEYRYGDLVFPREVFYVGKGHDEGTNKRRFDHFHPNHKSGNRLKMGILGKLKEFPKEKVCVIYRENMYEKDCFELEKELIQKIGRRDREIGPLANMTDGGEGDAGRSPSKEHIEKLRQANLGKIIPPEIREKMRHFGEDNHFNGKKHSDVSKEANRKAHLKFKYKIVFPDGRVFDEVESMKAFCKEHNLHQSNMMSVCYGKVNHYHGITSEIIGQEHLRENCKNLRPSYEYTLTDPNGNIHKPENLRLFCESVGLNYHTFSQLHKYPHRKTFGWTITREKSEVGRVLG